MLLRAVSVTLAAFLTGSGTIAQGPPATASIEHLLQTYLLKPCIASAIGRSELKTQELAHFERIGEGDVPPMQSLPPLPYMKLLAYSSGGCAGVFHRPEEIDATAAAIGAALGVEPGARQVSKDNRDVWNEFVVSGEAGRTARIRYATEEGKLFVMIDPG